MNQPVRSKMSFGAAIFAMLCLAVGIVVAQQPLPVAAPVAAPGAAGSDVVRIRKMTPVKEKTPAFKSATQQAPMGGRPTDWWRVVVDYETAPEWIDELEFTYYVYMKDQSNKGAEVMFRGTVTYINVPKGRHLSDMFLHPNVLARLGRVEQVAVVVKAKGAMVATESTAQTPNWWDRFSPVDGVLLNRAQTPFAFIEFDSFDAIKPAAAAR